jgi:hypothetical protein
MKTITHAQKKLMIKYFEVLEDELGRALESIAADVQSGETPLIETVSAHVHEQAVAIAARIPDASAPSMQQIRKNLEAVLDPTFFGASKGDPIKAVRALKQALREQPEYTKPKGGVWDQGRQSRRKAP